MRSSSPEEVKEDKIGDEKGGKEGWIIVFHNAPGNPEFEEWLHQHHFRRIASLAGVQSVRRLSIVEGESSRKFVALIRSTDMDSTITAVKGDFGQELIKSAGDHGVVDRQFFFLKTAFALEK